MKSFAYLVLIFLSSLDLVFANSKVHFFDRDGDHYNEEKQTVYKKGYLVLKTISEIDRNKDKRFDKLITTYYHHDRNKIYKIIKIDSDHDGKWDEKKVEIKTMSTTY